MSCAAGCVPCGAGPSSNIHSAIYPHFIPLYEIITTSPVDVVIDNPTQPYVQHSQSNAHLVKMNAALLNQIQGEQSTPSSAHRHLADEAQPARD